MKFLLPAALWALLGVAVLIIIYIIRSRHDDYILSSTYIWRLSERFQKNRLPLQRLRQFFLFLLQLLLIAGIAITAAHPAKILYGANVSYALIIDSSASMNIADGMGITRFERALVKISEFAETLNYGSDLSVILAADSPSYLIRRANSKNDIDKALNSAKCSMGHSDIPAALSLAQGLYEETGAVSIVLYTDTDYETVRNIEIIDMRDESDWNVAITSLDYEVAEGGFNFFGEALSMGLDTVLTASLTLDGKVIDAKRIEFADGEYTPFVFEQPGLATFERATVTLSAKDGLAEDNFYCVCRMQKLPANILICGLTPYYIQSVFEADERCTVTVAEYPDADLMAGFDLYIFDGCLPVSMPEDGAVWFIDPVESVNLDLSSLGIILGETIEDELAIVMPMDASGEAFKVLTDGITLTDAALNIHKRLIIDITWETILTCGEDPAYITKRMPNGLRISMLAFDLHASNIPMLSDFIGMTQNLLENSMPKILYETDFELGSSVAMSVLPFCESFYVVTPDDEILTFPTDGIRVQLKPEKPGIYSAMQTMYTGVARYVDFFVHMPVSESLPQTGGFIGVAMTAAQHEAMTSEASEGAEELKRWFAAALLILLLAEWGVYYYDRI